MGITSQVADGIAEIVMDNPPVNALTVAGWFELADVVTKAGQDQDVRAVVLRAEGRGFNAGVDIKEMQATEGLTALVGANRGCYAAFAAVYECEVPVIAAVNGFCLGGGIGPAGTARAIAADARPPLRLPALHPGALGRVRGRRGSRSWVAGNDMTRAEVAGERGEGVERGDGGGGKRRKPMALIREILRSPVKDLTVVSYGGPDVGLLCAAGEVKKVVFAFVSLDSIALEPHFRNAKQAGAVDTLELDQGMFLLGLQAAAWRRAVP